MGVGSVPTNNIGHSCKIHDMRVYMNETFTDEQALELYNSYLVIPQPTTPTSLVVTPTYLYPTSTISATGSGSDGDEYHYEFYDTTDSTLLQDYSVTNTYSLNQALRNHNIRISVKGYTSDADPQYSEPLSTNKKVYLDLAKEDTTLDPVDIIRYLIRREELKEIIPKEIINSVITEENTNTIIPIDDEDKII
jgi:hypothetical protein